MPGLIFTVRWLKGSLLGLKRSVGCRTVGGRRLLVWVCQDQLVAREKASGKVGGYASGIAATYSPGSAIVGSD